MIPSNVRIFLCSEAVDMRRGFDGLARAAREHLGKDVMEGGLFVFHARDLRTVKVLWVDGRGCCFLYKRLHGARFVLPRREGAVPAMLDAAGLSAFLAGAVREKGSTVH